MEGKSIKQKFDLFCHIKVLKRIVDDIKMWKDEVQSRRYLQAYKWSRIGHSENMKNPFSFKKKQIQPNE